MAGCLSLHWPIRQGFEVITVACRWEGCRLQMEAWQDVPVPLLAWEWLPQSVINTVSAAFEAFKVLPATIASPSSPPK